MGYERSLELIREVALARPSVENTCQLSCAFLKTYELMTRDMHRDIGLECLAKAISVVGEAEAAAKNKEDYEFLLMNYRLIEHVLKRDEVLSSANISEIEEKVRKYSLLSGAG